MMDGKAPGLEMEEDVGAKEGNDGQEVYEKEEEEKEEEEKEEDASSSRRTIRRSTGVGGKVPRLAINFKQVRKRVKTKVLQECFDVEDEEDVDEVTIVESGDESGSCNQCGQNFESKSNMEEHLRVDHRLLTCK